MFTVLLTAFEPFGGDPENASFEAVSRFSLADDAAYRVVTCTLPVVFSEAPSALSEAIVETHPDVVVCVGEAGSRHEITPETRAVNRAQATLADNSGFVAEGEPLDDGPEYLPSRLPNVDIVEALRSAGLPASLSDDAGAYLCNAAMRTALRAFDGPAGFIHVPAVRSVGVATVGAETDGVEAENHVRTDASGGENDKALTFDDLARALEIAIDSIYQTSSTGRSTS